MGISLLRRLGIKMALISGEASPLVEIAMPRKMHLPFVAKGTRDKAAALRDFTTKFKISLDQTCSLATTSTIWPQWKSPVFAPAHQMQSPKCSPTFPSMATFLRIPAVMALSALSPTPSSSHAISAAATSFNFVRRSNEHRPT